MINVSSDRDGAYWTRFARHAAAIGAKGKAVEHAFATLVSAYESDGRVYHRIDHVAAVLDVLEELLAPLASHPVAAFAAWYHDAVYDVHADDNEARSAAMAWETLIELGAESHIAERVATLILATAGHAIDAVSDEEGRAFLDADLAILGADPDTYQVYAHAVRREWAFVPDDAFAAGRAGILSSFLARERLFATDVMHARYEQQARVNLAREIAELRNSVER
jgi:predicted metal-dependent HD superfamily phosphohydrolase